MKEPIWIELREALVIHDRLLALHGGAPGLRDGALLASALSRPRHLMAYGRKIDLPRLAGALTAGILRNHPFVDGNKRTGFVLGVLFLELNGHRFVATEVAATKAVLALAAGELSEPKYVAFLRASLA